MFDKRDYFSNTPIYKIFIDFIDIVVPLFSNQLINTGFQAGDIVCNQEGIFFHFSNSQQTIELAFLFPVRKLCFHRRSIYNSETVDFQALNFQQLVNEGVEVNKELLRYKVEEWKEKMIKNKEM